MKNLKKLIFSCMTLSLNERDVSAHRKGGWPAVPKYLGRGFFPMHLRQLLLIQGGCMSPSEQANQGFLGADTPVTFDDIRVCDPSPVFPNDSGTDATDDTEIGEEHTHNLQRDEMRHSAYDTEQMLESTVNSNMHISPTEDPDLYDVLQDILSSNTTQEVLYASGDIPAILQCVDPFLKLTEEDVTLADSILATVALLRLTQCSRREGAMLRAQIGDETRYQQLLEVVQAQVHALPLNFASQAVFAILDLGFGTEDNSAIDPYSNEVMLLKHVAHRTIELASEGSAHDVADAVFAWAKVRERLKGIIWSTEETASQTAVLALIILEVESALLTQLIESADSSNPVWSLGPSRIRNCAWSAVTLQTFYPQQLGTLCQDLVYELAKEAYLRYKDFQNFNEVTEKRPSIKENGDANLTVLDEDSCSPSTQSVNRFGEEHLLPRSDQEHPSLMPSSVQGTFETEPQWKDRKLCADGICTVAWACAHFGVHDSHFFTMAILESAPLLNEMSMSQLSNLAWGLAVSGFYDPELAEQVLQLAQQQIETLHPEILGKLVKAFACWGHLGGDSFSAQALAETTQSLDFKEQEFRTEDYINIIWGFSKLVKSPDSKLQKWSFLIGRLGAHLEGKLTEATPSVLVDLLWSASVLDYQNQELINQACKLLVKDSVVESLSLSEIAALLVAVPKWKVPPKLLNKLHSFVLNNCEKFAAKDLICSIEALLEMGFEVPLERCLHLTSHQISQLNPTTLTKLLSVVTTDGFNDEILLQVILKDVDLKLLSFSPSDLAKTAVCLSKLSKYDTLDLSHTTTLIMRQFEKDMAAFSPQNFQEVASALASLLLPHDFAEFMKNNDAAHVFQEWLINKPPEKKLSRQGAFSLGKCFQLLQKHKILNFNLNSNASQSTDLEIPTRC